MQPRSLPFHLPALFAALALGACGGSSSGSPDAGDVVNCGSDPRVFTYSPNMTVTSSKGAMKVSLVSDPAPPAHGNDTWNLHITNGSGTAMPGLSLQVSTLMPDHGHGSPTTPAITDKGGGDYTVTPLYLFMPGVWHVWFFTSAAPSDTADFWFCVQG